MIRAKDETVWMRMKEKGNKAAGRTGPDDGIGGEWSKINVRTYEFTHYGFKGHRWEF